MCGMCLPHCPTYQIMRDEGESPRGRIALIQGLANGRLALNERLENHLDHCLGCRACEAVCPSGVPYGEIIDGGRALIRQTRQKSSSPQDVLTGVVKHRGLLRWLGRALRLYQRSGLQSFIRTTGIARTFGLGRLDALLPPINPLGAWRPYHPPSGEARGEVALFLGCFAEFADRPALNAAILILTRLGYGVHIPAAQACCGALHLHQGDAQTARDLAQRNADAFNALRVDAVISTASGCGATLAEYPQTHFPRIQTPIRDISEFLAGVPWFDEITFAPLARRVAIHDPCSLSHVLHKANYPYDLLKRIPKLEMMPLPDNRRCCGAAGNYMLTQPEIADRLRDDKIAALRSLNADILVTSNLGCALHLRAGIRAAGLHIEAMHPVALLARQLQATSSNKG